MDRCRSALILFLFLLFPGIAFAYSPVARFDVVPYQRIAYEGSLNVGVVAFSKPGIDNVVFTISGQGYASGTKTSSAMALNSTTSTWEYYVNIPASEFSSNGAITVSALVTDLEANTRTLTLSLIVQGASAHVSATCWADSVSGNNTTCTADDEAAPCATIAGCISKLGASASGDIIYLEEGTYSADTSATTSTADWLTITKDDTAAVANVIINAGQLATGYLKYDSVTLQSQGSGLYVATSDSTYLWTNNTRRIGSGRATINTNPVHYSDADKHFSTGDYTYNSDYAYRKAALVRGAEISTIGNDVFENTGFVVNSTADNITNGANPSWHADGYQVFATSLIYSPPASNRIIYNYKATDVHYQGIFMRSDVGTATDNAFVNVAIEMRDTCDNNETGICSFAAFSVYQNWDHLLIWNSSFINGLSILSPTSVLTNSSVVGNSFWQFSSDTAITTLSIPQLANGNAGGNEALYNHFEYVKLETGECTPNSRFIQAGWSCPKNYTKRPDSGAVATYTEGGGVIDQDSASATFLSPVDSSVLVDRFTSRVPVDINNLQRGATSDVGAVEFLGAGVSGTIVADNMTESNMVSGGTTIDITVVGDTLEASIDAYRQEFINSCVSEISAVTESAGWNAEIVADEAVTAITRVNDTLLRWTLSANAAYAISQNDGTISCYIPHEMLVTATEDVIPTPSFFISNETPVSLSPQTGIIHSASGKSGQYSATGANIQQ